MRAALIAVVLAAPLWAETARAPETAPDAAEQSAAPACSSCDARKAGLARLKAAREADLTPPKAESTGDE